MAGLTRRILMTAVAGLTLSAGLIVPGGHPARAASAPVRQSGLTQAPPTGIDARAAELYDETANKQLWGRDQYSKLPMASITKVMTALVVIDDGDLTRQITITKADVNYVQSNGASNAGLHAGDVLTASQLLIAMLLPSGADAARALAVSYGPGWRAFVDQMNALAVKLKLVGTHFSNFDGLPYPTATSDHSTARNLLMLGKAAMAQPAFASVVGLQSYSLPAGPHNHAYRWQNTNLLLGSYPGAIGIKTGWTPSAGECLLFEVSQGGRVLMGVVLHSAATADGQSFADATNLLNWALGQSQPPPAPNWPASTARE